jgi:chromosome segregation ATPase|tara:strand:- start:5522 stop:5776 length:255 start_codon:yes stop_codon:yes gene_type:complete
MYLDEKADELMETLLQVERQRDKAEEALSEVRRLLAQACLKMKEQEKRVGRLRADCSQLTTALLETRDRVLSLESELQSHLEWD